MRRCSFLLILLGAALPSLSQLQGRKAAVVFRVYLRADSTSGEKTQVQNEIDAGTEEKLLVEADSADARRNIFDKDLLIEVIHARGTSALTTISLMGLKAFEENDVMKTLRPALRAGDRLVLTFKMMSDRDPFHVRIINIK